jgi:hypothetical protein
MNGQSSRKFPLDRGDFPTCYCSHDARNERGMLMQQYRGVKDAPIAAQDIRERCPVVVQVDVVLQATTYVRHGRSPLPSDFFAFDQFTLILTRQSV